ncbi:Ethanolamine ammonia-lyase [Thiocapsa marina 5811]|uniref:Ethanolamine ammonia-lyase n=1 Tax=Thiocapsa marina 5811 TaxID=768671 RepID=F9UG54_9GAMM|nr:Ethanolamine ammonia-lyase [Thiocapsa marina 5811]
MDAENIAAHLDARGWTSLRLRSAAASRFEYLQRPDMGRRLDIESRALLDDVASASDAEPDVVFVIADGLSARAIHENALPFLDRIIPDLLGAGWRVGPVPIIEQGRVAIGDEIGERLGAEILVILIGERPGLSSPDSLGVYLTHGPHVGKTDADRNCLSNIRSAGLGHEAASYKLRYLLDEARRRRISGVSLKEDASSPEHLESHADAITFLLPNTVR